MVPSKYHFFLLGNVQTLLEVGRLYKAKSLFLGGNILTFGTGCFLDEQVLS